MSRNKVECQKTCKRNRNESSEFTDQGTNNNNNKRMKMSEDLKGNLCDFCGQIDSKVDVFADKSNDYVEEFIALADERLSLDTSNSCLTDFIPTYYLIDFSIYDRKKHLCQLDSGLIEMNVSLFCSGYIFPITEEDFHLENGIKAKDIGPINEWYISGFDGGEDTLLGISTQYAEYYLKLPHAKYKSYINLLYEKSHISKIVIEYLIFNDEPTYEDLIDNLKNVKMPKTMAPLTEESLLKYSSFICDQVMSLDLNSLEDGDQEYSLLTTPCMRSLIKLTGLTISDNIQSNEKIKTKNKTLISKITDSKYKLPTTTKLVGEILNKFLPQIRVDDKNGKIVDPGCGKCKICKQKDCGSCAICRNRKSKSKCSRKAKEICLKRRCPFKAIEKAINSDDEQMEQESNEHQAKSSKNKSKFSRFRSRCDLNWPEPPTFQSEGKIYHSQVNVNGTMVSRGDFIVVEAECDTEELVKVINMWENEDKSTNEAHVHCFYYGKDTFLGNDIAADNKEVFASTKCKNINLDHFVNKCDVVYHNPTDYFNRIPSSSREKTFYYSKMYFEDSGRFEDFVLELNGVDEALQCHICQYNKQIEDDLKPKALEPGVVNGNRTSYNLILYKKVEYKIGDGVYICPSAVKFKHKFCISIPEKPPLDSIDHEKYPEFYRKYYIGDHVKGSNFDTPEPFAIGYVKSIYKVNAPGNQSEADDIFLVISKLYRNENTHDGERLITSSNINQLYWSDEECTVPFAKVMGKCRISYIKNPDDCDKNTWTVANGDEFYFSNGYDESKEMFYDLEMEVERDINLILSNCSNVNAKDQRDEGKRLKTMDLFAGCGGLSFGVSNSRITDIRWAIEKDYNAGLAYKKNHPNTAMFVTDCNDFLSKVMEGKDLSLPQKGDVELILGGPPCQGFTRLNRHKYDTVTKNLLTFTYLSFCDYYKPKFIVMENVQNFTLQNKGLMLKITIDILLKIGYQCSFSILQAGNFGLPQSRRRFILLGAAPGQKLPQFPEPIHVFSKRSCQLDIIISGRKLINSNEWKNSAPHRSIMVRDAISDLPVISNGHSNDRIPYESTTISHFQRFMRRRCAAADDYVYNHICKNMSPLVEARISHIPRYPGADWRDLPNIVVKLSDDTFTKKLVYIDIKKTGNNNRKVTNIKSVCSCGEGLPCDILNRQENTLIPWCLPHTSDKHNGWSGTYGRLHWDGFFSTTITNPEPLGQQGRILHPEQNRVVSVRECARSQGFPDDYTFKGGIQDKYRQIGNAVPPLLAQAIGYQIKKVL